jgi:glycosyltransferase involved in cell wall biosynthesis
MNPMDTGISVILVVKNGEPYLAKAIESVLAQAHRPLEILLVDGNSRDATPQIAARYPQVTLIPQTGQGLAQARNQAVAFARGEWLAFLDGDDYWAPDKLARQTEFHRAHPSCDFSVGWMKFFLEPGAVLRPGFRAATFQEGEIGYTPGTLFARRSAFARVGGFDESLSIACDADWFARLHDRGEWVAEIPRVLLHKRIHSDNLSGRVKQNRDELMRMLRRSVARKRSGPGIHQDTGKPVAPPCSPKGRTAPATVL